MIVLVESGSRNTGNNTNHQPRIWLVDQNH